MSTVVADLNDLSDADFRLHARQWIEANYPPEIRNPPKRLHYRDTKVWYQKLSRKGWLCPGWPREFGGMGLSPGKQLIMLEEKERHGCARSNDMGVTMLGPLLIRHGSKEQQDHYLPKILTGEHIWYQGYSEPNAGSDLASLRTEAVLDGEHWVVNGQKIWTSIASPVVLCADAAASAGGPHGRLGGGGVSGSLHAAPPRPRRPQGAVQRVRREGVPRRGARA
jgi:alkylation response protein AidB-like acyl-CoA dehydrogenase